MHRNPQNPVDLTDRLDSRACRQPRIPLPKANTPRTTTLPNHLTLRILPPNRCPVGPHRVSFDKAHSSRPEGICTLGTATPLTPYWRIWVRRTAIGKGIRLGTLKFSSRPLTQSGAKGAGTSELLERPTRRLTGRQPFPETLLVASRAQRESEWSPTSTLATRTGRARSVCLWGLLLTRFPARGVGEAPGGCSPVRWSPMSASQPCA